MKSPNNLHLAMLTAAPHRMMFFAGMVNLFLSSALWSLHLAARYAGRPLFALDLEIAPVWAHSFLMLFAVLPSFIFGFLFTTYPRWMGGPEVSRPVYTGTGVTFMLAAGAWILGVHGPAALRLTACGLAVVAMLTAVCALESYSVWRPLWVLVAVVSLCYARLLLGTAGALHALVFADAALLLITAYCAMRWSSAFSPDRSI
jgi:uncharacterized protein involved in response to NO